MSRLVLKVVESLVASTYLFRLFAPTDLEMVGVATSPLAMGLITINSESPKFVLTVVLMKMQMENAHVHLELHLTVQTMRKENRLGRNAVSSSLHQKNNTNSLNRQVNLWRL